MENNFPSNQTYTSFEQQWNGGFRPSFPAVGFEPARDDVVHGTAATSLHPQSSQPNYQPSMLKTEATEDYHQQNVWFPQHSIPQIPARHYSQPVSSNATMYGSCQPYPRGDPNFAASYMTRPLPFRISQTEDEALNALPGIHEIRAQAVQYGQSQPGNNRDQKSASSISPHSSQGGWQAAASPEEIEHNTPQSPVAIRFHSPQMVHRPDGYRKKNARFEIPEERNLHTIDAMIQRTENEDEKRELKQQKRLLRNRQAALDSRQRKKSHTEKLEQEKSRNEQRTLELQQMNAELLNELELAKIAHQEQMMSMLQQMEHLQTERDNYSRQLLELDQEHQRKMKALQEFVKEQQVLTNQPYPLSDIDNFRNELDDIHLDDEFDMDFHDADADKQENNHRETTPRPKDTQQQVSVSEAGFSWNTFYMCLLIGAMVTAGGQGTSKTSKAMTMPAISEEYRVDASNVLHAVMASGSDAQHFMPSLSRSTIESQKADVSQYSDNVYSFDTPSSLDYLSSTLTTPSKFQQAQQAFSISESTYNHVMNPYGMDEDNVEADFDDDEHVRPSRLDLALKAQLQCTKSKENIYVKTRADERSAVLEHVPRKVLDEFRIIARQNGMNL